MAEKRLGREASVLSRAHERARESAAAFEVPRELGGPIAAAFRPCPRPWLGRVPGLEVARDDRVWLRGPSGAGKTTLLRRWLEAAPRERILHLPQELDPRDPLRRLASLDPAARGHTLSILAALGVERARLIASPSPSPGEARKLAVAIGLGTAAWALALDEPTNHLDLPAIERLQAALCAYTGALVLITHDQQLARACTHREVRLD
jgi:ATPase subunit of ABC transporter with duplicated ATPase domains